MDSSKGSYIISQYVPPYKSFGRNNKLELDLSSYTTKTDLKNVTHVDVSSFTSKTNLANLKTEVDKINIAKLTPVSDDLAKLRNVVKKDVVKKTEYDKLVTKVDNIDTTGFVLKTKSDADKSELKKKISDLQTDLNAKITEIEGQIPSITGLATNSALTAVENKIPDVSSLVRKTDYDTKISEIENKVSDHNHDKYITTLEFNISAARVFNARLAQSDLVTKTDLILSYRVLVKRLLQIKQSIWLLKMN